VPRIAPRRQRRFGGVDNLVISLIAKGLTTAEVMAHLHRANRVIANSKRCAVKKAALRFTASMASQ